MMMIIISRIKKIIPITIAAIVPVETPSSSVDAPVLAEKSQYRLVKQLFVYLEFYAISTVFQLFNGDSSQIHASWTILPST